MAKAWLILILHLPYGDAVEANYGLFNESLCLQEMHKVWEYKNDAIDAACVPEFELIKIKLMKGEIRNG